MNWHLIIAYIVVSFGIVSSGLSYLLRSRGIFPRKINNERREIHRIWATIGFGLLAVPYLLTMGIDALTLICSFGTVTACAVGILLSYQRYRWWFAVRIGKTVGPYPNLVMRRKNER